MAKLRNLLISLLALIIVCSDGSAQITSSIQTIHQKMTEDIIKCPSKKSKKHNIWLSQLKDNGQWSDVDYSCNDSAKKALVRLKILSNALNCEDSLIFYKEKIGSALVYYSRNVPRTTTVCNENWFDIQITSNRILAEILLICKEYLSPEILIEATGPIRSEFGRAKSSTGQNRIWKSELMLAKGIILNDTILINKAINEGIIPVLSITPSSEGVQSDFSFHQHNSPENKGLLYSGGYGLNFLFSITKLAYYLDETKFDFSSDQIEFIQNYALIGIGGMMFRGKMDYHSIGRKIASPQKSIRDPVTNSLEKLKMVSNDTSKQTDIQIFIDSLNRGQTYYWNNNFYYWRSHFMTHFRNDFYTSVKLVSSGTIGTEILNGFNKKGNWLSFGSMFILKSGEEYENIFPLLDWNLLPGTTTSTQIQRFRGNFSQNSHFVGGVSDGIYGASAMILDKLGIYAKKSWFFYDNEIVCLGSDIKVNKLDTLRTTLNQTIQSNKLSFSLDKKLNSLENGKVAGQIDWVHHDDIAYIPLDNANYTLTSEVRKSNWKSIGKAARSENKKVFTLIRNHISDRDNYSYLIIPNKKIEELINHVPHNIKVIQNDGNAQIVLYTDKGIYMGVFYSNTISKLDQHTSISLSTPGLFMIKELYGNTSVTLSTPNHDSENIILRVETKAESEGLQETVREFKSNNLGNSPAGKPLATSLEQVDDEDK